MSDRQAQSVHEPGRGRFIAWLFALLFACFASGWAAVRLPSALDGWGWENPKGLELLFALARSAGPLLVALSLIFLLWRRLGLLFSRSRRKVARSEVSVQRSERAVEPGSNLPRAFLWLVALAFLCLAAYRARDWFPVLWFELNNPTSSLKSFFQLAVVEAGPLFLALCLLAVLWKVVGPPFSIRQSGSQEPAKSVARREGRIDDELQPTKLEFPSSRRKDREARPERERRAALRSLAWTAMAVLLFATAGWALLFFACGGNDMFSLISARRDGFERLSLGIMSVGGVIFLSLILWAVIGPPFQRPPK